MRGMTDAPFAGEESIEEEGNEFFDLKDVVMAPLRGIEGFAQSIYNLGDFVVGDALPDWDRRFLGKSESTVGGFVEGATQFLTAFVPIGGALGKAGQGLGLIQKGAKGVEYAGSLAKAGAGVQRAAKIGKGALQGAIADFVAFDGQDQRLSNLIESVPALKNPVTEYLQADPNDNEIEGRFKNVIEGLFLEAGQQALAPLFTRGVKALKEYKGNIKSGMAPEEAAKAANEAFQTEVGGEVRGIVNPPIFERGDVPEAPLTPAAAPKPELGIPLETAPKINLETGLPFEDLKGGEQARETIMLDVLRNTKSPKELADKLVELTEMLETKGVDFKDPKFSDEQIRSNYAAAGLDPNDWDKLKASTDPTIFNRLMIQQDLLKTEVRRSGEEYLALTKKTQGKSGDELLEAEARAADAGIKYQHALGLYSQYGTGSSLMMLQRKVGGGIKASDLPSKPEKQVLDNYDKDLETKIKDLETATPESLLSPKVVDGKEVKAKTADEVKSDYDNRIQSLETKLQELRDSAFKEPADPKAPKKPKAKTAEQRDLEAKISFYKSLQADDVKLAETLAELDKLSKMTPQQVRKETAATKAKKGLQPSKPTKSVDELKARVDELRNNMVKAGKEQMTSDTILRREDFIEFSKQRLGSKTQEELNRTLSLIDNIDDVEKRMAMLAYSQNATMGRKMFDMTHEFFINSLFSPATHVVNALGGMSMNILKNAEAIVGRALVGDFAYVKAHFNALTTVQGMHEILEAGVLAMKTGESVLKSSEIRAGKVVEGSSQFDGRVYGGAISANTLGLNPESQFATFVDWVGKISRINTTLLVGGDEVMKQVFYRQFLRTELYAEGLQKGIKEGNALTNYVERKLSGFVLEGGKMYNEKSLFQAYNNKAKQAGLTPDMGVEYDKFIAREYEKNPFSKTQGALSEAAHEYALKMTFSNEAGDVFTKGVMNVLEAVPVLKFILPFVKTPTNILKFGLSRSPLGLAKDSILLLTSSKYRDLHVNGTPAMKAELVGRMTTAATFTFGAMYYMMNNEGAVTGGGPQNKEERDALKATGWQPYSIKIGGKYISYNRLDPVATPLGILADITEFNKVNAPKTEDAASNAMSALLVSLTYNLTDKSYLRGLNNMMNMLRDPETYGPKTIQDIAAGFVPNTLNQLQNTEQQVVLRESRSVTDAMMKRIPSLSDNLPPQRNFLGDALYKENPLGLLNMFSPVYISTPKNDIVDREVGELLHGFSMPPAKLHGIDDLDMREHVNAQGKQAYDRYLELSGTTTINNKNLRQALTTLLKSPEYKAFPKGNIQDQIGKSSPRITAINRVVKRYRNKAQLEMLGEFPELYQKSKELSQKQRDYRLGKFENQQ